MCKKKHAKPLLQWIGPIRNHFWYICRDCNQDEEVINITSSSGIRSKAASALAPSIASVQPPSTADLVRIHVSRKLMAAHEI